MTDQRGSSSEVPSPPLGSLFKRPCWYCQHDKLMVLPASFEGVITAVCHHCGLIQRRTLDLTAEECPEPTAFYEQQSQHALNWLNKRTIYDTGRLAGYIDLIFEHCPADQIHTALDAGCAEGLFSHVLKTRLPAVAAYGLDPDRFCIDYGRKRYPEIILEHGLIERYTPTQKFDLITDFGAIYRCVDPVSVLRNYQEMLSEQGTLVLALICSTESLGDANKAVPPDSPSGIWPAEGTHGFVRFIADPELFAEMLGQHFESVEMVWKRLTPYRKHAPFFFARKPRPAASEPPSANPVRVLQNTTFLLDYALRQSTIAVEKLVAETGAKRVALYGVSEESANLVVLLRRIGVEVCYQIHPFAHRLTRKNDRTPLRFLNAVIDEPVDLVIIADYQNQEAFSGVVAELGLQSECRFFLAFEKRPQDGGLFAEIAGQRFLQKAFRFTELKP